MIRVTTLSTLYFGALSMLFIAYSFIPA